MSIYSTKDFPQFSHIRGHWKTIRDEYLAVEHLAEKWPPQAFRGTPVDGHDGVVDNNNGHWDFLPLYIDGKWLVSEEICPETQKLLKDIKGLWLAGFSILRPSCEIFPHRGPEEPEVFKYHLGLIANPGPWLNIGGQEYHWKEGYDVIFDDAIEHFAKNPTDKTRVVLMVDISKKENGYSVSTD